MATSFTHTHIHTQFSILESTIKIPDLVAHIQTLGMRAVAITDTQNMFGMIQFSQHCAKAGIKPLIGCQVSVLSPATTQSPKAFLSRLILIAKTQNGYQNLSRLLTTSYVTRQDALPHVTKDQLSHHREGLLAIMPMETGEWVEHFRNQRMAEITSSMRWYQSLFGEDFYAEVVRPVAYALLTNFEHHLLELGHTNQLKLIATNAAQYLNPKDYFGWRVLSGIREGTKIESPQEECLRTGFRDVCSPSTMAERFADCPHTILATEEVTQKVEFDFPFAKSGYRKIYHLPRPPISQNVSVEQAFARECQEGLRKRLAETSTIASDLHVQYWERLAYEIRIITEMDFCGYFLIVMDFVRYAKSCGIPVGPGRGSGAGSLASYALDITNLDPIHHGLLFERFLNPERISLPDFDIDFCMDRRWEVIQYVVEKYGHQKVAQIITFGKLQTRLVIRDVGRVFGLTPAEVDKLAKLVPDILGITIQEAIQKEPTLHNLIQSKPNMALLFDTAMALEGLVRHASVHAAGLVIANDSLDTYCPLYLGKDGVATTQLDMNDLEQIGLIKFDFLGLKTLTMLDKAQKDIRMRIHSDFSFSNIPLDDPAVYAQLSLGNTSGVFQLESPGMQDLCKKLKPDRFEDITAINALYRPGPLGSGMVDDFIDRKHGRKKIVYDLPQLEPILKETYGVIVYQEQVQQLAVVLAGYSLGSADNLRRAMGKKKPEEMANERDRFMTGAMKNRISAETAKHLFDLMSMFAEYGFNKSHAAAYALLSYQTAYLKTHYPSEFYASLLTIEMGFSDKLKRYIDDAKAHDLVVLPPDVNLSLPDFMVVDSKTIRFGLLAIKGLGLAALENIITERKNGPYLSLLNFCNRVDLQKTNRRVIEALIKSGAFDYTKLERATLYAMLDPVMSHAAQIKNKGLSHQSSLFGSTESDVESSLLAEPPPPAWDTRTLAAHERQHLGCYLTNHPFDQYDHIRQKLGIKSASEYTHLPPGSKISIFGIVLKIKTLTTKAKETRTLLTCEDRIHTFEITCYFDNLTKNEKPLLEAHHIYVFHAVVERSFQNKLRLKVVEPKSVERLDEHLADGMRFCVHFTLNPSVNMPAFYALIEKHHGLSPCMAHLAVPSIGHVYLRLPKSGVSITPKLIEDTKSLLGINGIHIEYLRHAST